LYVFFYPERRATQNDNGKIIVENAASADNFIREYDIAGSGNSQGSDLVIPVGKAELLNKNARLTGPVVSKWRQRSHSESTDPAWTKEAKVRLATLASNVPYMVAPPQIQCGTDECEVSVTIMDGLSDYDKKRIQDILAQPAYGKEEDRFFTLRQIWSNEDIGEEGSGFHAYYMKR
jgi:hypothetical protein